MNRKKYGLFLGFYGIMLLLVLFFWGESIGWDLSYSMFYSLARLSALLGFLSMTFQLITSARWRFLEKGIGLDRLLSFHRVLGIVAFFLIFYHAQFLVLRSTLLGLESTGGIFILFGSIANILLLIVVFTSIFYRKLRIPYGVWRGIHFLTYIIYILGFIHSVNLGTTLFFSIPLLWIWYACGIVASVSAIKNIVNKFAPRRHPLPILEVRSETHDITTLEIERPNFDYLPGQFAFLEVGKKGTREFPHPFTIASSPDSQSLQFSIKAIGDFTTKVKELEPGDKIYIDGPYGVFSFFNDFEKDGEGARVCIAGGIGITPFISNLRALRDRKDPSPVTLIWGNKTVDDLPFLEELRSFQELRIVHVFSQYSSLDALPPNFEAEHVETGFVDGGIIDKYLPEASSFRFYLCGPPVMMKKMKMILKARGVKGPDIRYEKFSF